MRNKRDYVGAIFLIFAGVIFLLNTTGVLSWSIWINILNYWPVFLILGGLRLILGKSLISTIIISILAFLLFTWIGISAYVRSRDVSRTFLRHFPVVNYNIDSVENVSNEFTIKNDLEVESLDYNFDLGVIQFNISDGSDDFLYIDANYNTAYGEPEITEEKSDKNLDMTIRETQSRTFPFFNFTTPKYDISLGSELPTNIRIDNGVGNGALELNNQKIQNLTVRTGTGEVDINLGFDSIPTEKLNLDIGTGNIKLNLPSNIGYLITYNLGVGEINLGETKISGIGQDANEVKSENYETAEKIIKIITDVGVGQLDINFNN